jgi:hypothetical protein
LISHGLLSETLTEFMHVFRPEPNSVPDPAIYVAADGLPDELWRGIQIALGGVVPQERLFFHGDPAGWEAWCRSAFGPALVPVIRQARELGCSGVRDWSAADLAFAEANGSGPGVERSLRLGRVLAERHAGARQFQPLDRLRRHLMNHPEAGHAATVVAFLSAQFNVATTACLVACLFLEWRGAFPETPERDFASMTPNLGTWLPAWLGAGSFPALKSPSAG